jgi:hypothetical protein
VGKVAGLMRSGAPLAGVCAGFASLRLYAGVPFELSEEVRGPGNFGGISFPMCLQTLAAFMMCCRPGLLTMQRSPSGTWVGWPSDAEERKRAKNRYKDELAEAKRMQTAEPQHPAYKHA